jgi:hypothetical protein
MYPNLIQPVTDYTHAQVESLTRFAQSRDIAELTRSSVENFWRLVQENQSRFFQSDALTQLVKANVENWSRFAQDYSSALYSVVSEAQSQFTRGIQDGTRVLQQAANTGSNIVRTAAEETTDAVKVSAEEAAEETHDLAKARSGRRHS